MAVMYPRVFPETNKSSGEKKVFEYLRDYAPDSWHVIHSFRIPNHSEVVFGECDFIVIAPPYGIVFLEIKSGGVGISEEQLWQFINREHKITEKKRGPFEQAREGMFNIEQIIKDRVGEEYSSYRILFNYGVIFTDENHFDISKLTEDETWRLMQNNGKYPDYIAFIKKLFNNFKNELSRLGKRVPAKLSDDEARYIAKKLRPTFECVPPIKSFMDESEADIIKLTDEQLSCLDDIELNKRVVVLGGAGTGKTVIALEDARRAASLGLRTCILCYNKNLRDVIRQNIKGYSVDVYTVHGLMMKICGDTVDETQTNSVDFFDKELPHLASLSLKSSGSKYDKIIVDEFQDSCTQFYLEFFDVLLSGGLMDGVFSFYADFTRQAIYHSGSSLELLEQYAYFTKKKLNINCRNTLYIGNEMINISGFDDKNYKLSITGEPVDYLVYTSEENEKELLLSCLKDLQKAGFNSKDIIVLSRKKRSESIVAVSDPIGCIIGDYGCSPEGFFAMFSTIQSFKGLESKIVIITDVEDYKDEKLMYVGLSRARSKLFVIESKVAYKERKDLVSRRLIE